MYNLSPALVVKLASRRPLVSSLLVLWDAVIPAAACATKKPERSRW